jgi:thymidylate kinase
MGYEIVIRSIKTREKLSKPKGKRRMGGTATKSGIILKPKSSKKSSRKAIIMPGFVFSLEGAHGVGKSTVYYLLQEKFKENGLVEFFPERSGQSSPFPFGSKDKQIAFRSELYYNQQMMARNKAILEFIRGGRNLIAIADRSPYSTIVYTRALQLPKPDWDLIKNTFNSEHWADDFIIYLQAKPEIIMERIYKRGSLDQERLKWNEQDLEYLKLILEKYEDTFTENKFEENGRLYRIDTDDKTPQQVAQEVTQIITNRTAINLEKKIKPCGNQAKLTAWFASSEET